MSLKDSPQEILCHVTQYLKLKEVKVLSSLNTHLRECIQTEEFIWKIQFHILFEDIIDFEDVKDWKETLITYLKAEKRCKEPHLITLSANGDLPAVRIMVKRFSFKKKVPGVYSCAVRVASKNGHFEVVKSLLKNTPRQFYDEALI